MIRLFIIAVLLIFVAVTVLVYFVGDDKFLQDHWKRIFYSVGAYVLMQIFSMLQAQFTGTGGAPGTPLYMHAVGWLFILVLTLLPVGIFERMSKVFDASHVLNWLVIAIVFWVTWSIFIDVLTSLAVQRSLWSFNVKIVIFDIALPACVAAFVWWKHLPASRISDLGRVF